MKADSNTIQPSEAISLPVSYDHVTECIKLADETFIALTIDGTDDEIRAVGEHIALALNSYPELSAEVTELKAEIERLKAALEESINQGDRFHDGLYQIADWAKAYPVKNWPEPTKEDWTNIADVLKVAGFSLDCISASNMRHVITKVGDIARQALSEK